MSNPASVPTPVEDVQGDRRWMSIHERFLKDCKRHEPNVVFIGDSLIDRLQTTPTWKQYFEPLHCLNFGVGGDQTQHVIWRIENGELNFETHPKVVVLLIGTNNHDHTAEQVADGILTIVKKMRIKLPKSNIVVLGIPPRGREPNRLREKIKLINHLVETSLKKLDEESSPSITFMCCSNWHDFINPQDGTISHNDMGDYLHFTNEGYEKFCEPIYEKISQILNSSASN